MMRRQQHTHCKYRNQQHPIMYSVSSLLLLSISVLLLNDVPYSRTHCSAFTVQVPIASSSSSRWNKNNHHHHQHQFRKSLLLASVVPDVTATTSPTNSSIESSSWIQNGIEQKLTNGLSSLSNRITNAVIGPGKVLIYDTTLRDGTQGESVSASVDDKFKIVSKLTSFDVDYIEAGWPGSNPKDAEFFTRAQTELNDVEKSKLVAFGSTCRKNTAPQDDAQVKALLDSLAPTICIVAKSHLWQVTEILKASPEENIRMISDTVKYLVSQGRQVFVDLEHYFDGYRSDRQYALDCCRAATDAGASCLVLCDTNGGTMPWDIATICASTVSNFNPQITIGIHCHNDCGMAVANSLMAVQNGVGLIQGTINGIGERTGNADLCSIIPSLAFHVNQQHQHDNNDSHSENDDVEGSDTVAMGGSDMKCRSRISEITSLSRYVDEILNRTPYSAAPYVGSSAFAHKGGLHVAAMERSSASYQHIEPQLVGNQKRVLVSELSGRQNIIGKMKEQFGITDGALSNEAELSNRAMAILKRVKNLEAAGYTFEGADASVHLMILHSTKGYCPPFQVLDYTANVYDSNIDSASRVLFQDTDGSNNDNQNHQSRTGAQARATVKIRTFNPPDTVDTKAGTAISSTDGLYYRDLLEVSDGNGPVDALAQALMRALVPYHPYLQSIELIDYKVRILDPASATQAATRVMVEFRDNSTEKTWTTVSVDTNVISASLNALIDGFEYALIEHAESCSLCEDFF